MKWPEVKSYPISSIMEQRERERNRRGERQSDERIAVYLTVMTKLILYQQPPFLICEISGLWGSRVVWPGGRNSNPSDRWGRCHGDKDTE